MSDFEGGGGGSVDSGGSVESSGSEVSSSSEVSESSAETGGESSAETQEATADEADDSGFDDSETTESSDYEEDEEIEAEEGETSDEDESGGFDGDENAEDYDSGEDAEDVETDSEADEDKVGFDEETDEDFSDDEDDDADEGSDDDITEADEENGDIDDEDGESKDVDEEISEDVDPDENTDADDYDEDDESDDFDDEDEDPGVAEDYSDEEETEDTDDEVTEDGDSDEDGETDAVDEESDNTEEETDDADDEVTEDGDSDEDGDTDAVDEESDNTDEETEDTDDEVTEDGDSDEESENEAEDEVVDESGEETEDTESENEETDGESEETEENGEEENPEEKENEEESPEEKSIEKDEEAVQKAEEQAEKNENENPETDNEKENPDKEEDAYQISDETRENLASFEQGNWDQLSNTEKDQAIHALRDSIADDLGLQNKPNISYYYEKDPGDFGGYAESNNTIYINTYNIDNAKETADTIAHESRHCWQHERAELGETEQDKAFKENFENYSRPEHNFEKYRDQLVERDAREYAAAIKDQVPDGNPPEGQPVEKGDKPVNDEHNPENANGPPEDFAGKRLSERPDDLEAKEYSEEECEKLAAGIKGESDYRKTLDECFRDPSLTPVEKQQISDKIYSKVADGNKTNISHVNNPEALSDDPQKIKEATEKGRLAVAFHDHHGLDETKGICGIGDGKEMPDTVCRMGGERGNNISELKADGSFPTTNELSVPYAENPEAMHVYKTDPEGYKEAIDIISETNEGNVSEKTEAMNELIDKMNDKHEGINDHITEKDMLAFKNEYDYFQNHAQTKQCDCNSKYGVAGTAAPFYVNDDPGAKKLCDGGAPQYNTPCSIKTLKTIGVFNEYKK